ncbi:MAG: SDR family oxidoreductase [Caulobacter sp.]|nr:SDR family oxidoreductase [Caulobacter sp.]
MARWTTANIPDQGGRAAVVTGPSGLGYETALALAMAGAEVIVAGRNPDKGAAAVSAILKAAPLAKVRFEPLDLASLASVAAFGSRLQSQRQSLDLLINNAGVMTPPTRRTTADGFELQLGVNYLGHFALTGRLMPLLKRGRAPRVVTLSSIAARNGAINLGDLNAQSGYRPMAAYSQSKLACLMFALELQRRSATSGWGVNSIAAHPGVSRTDLLLNAPARFSLERFIRRGLPFLFQPVAQGALPTLYAATSAQAEGGQYYGPDRMGETRGYPARAKTPPQARDEMVAERLWSLSEDLAGVRF